MIGNNALKYEIKSEQELSNSQALTNYHVVQNHAIAAFRQSLDKETFKDIYGKAPYMAFAVDWNGSVIYANYKGEMGLKKSSSNLKIISAPRDNIFTRYNLPSIHNIISNLDELELPEPIVDLVRETLASGKSLERDDLIYLPNLGVYKWAWELSNLNIKNHYNKNFKYFHCFSYLLLEDRSQHDLGTPAVLIAILPVTPPKVYTLYDIMDVSDDSSDVHECFSEQVAAGLANKLRNPLAAVKGCMQLMSSNPEKALRKMGFLNVALKELEVANKHLKDFIMCLQPNFPIKQKIDANMLVLEALSKLDTSDCKNNVKIKIKHSYEDVLLHCDYSQAVKAICHVMSNAFDYAPPGSSVHIEIYFNHRTKYAIISIKDQGHGIDNSIIDKVFEPYFTTAPNKVGLGLSIAKALLENNEGYIRVGSTNKNGTEIIIAIPTHYDMTYEPTIEQIPLF